jgi:hypothetical protein
MWEKEQIDKYLEQAKDKIGFVKAVREKMFAKCLKDQSSINVLNYNSGCL